MPRIFHPGKAPPCICKAAILRKIAKQHQVSMVHLCCPVMRCRGYSEGRA